MCSYCKRHTESEVPDPYYGGAKGFEKVSQGHHALARQYMSLHLIFQSLFN